MDQAVDRLIVAVDVPGREEARILAERLGDSASWLKFGLELFIAEGPGLVAEYSKSYSIMLDLKLHDIPATVARATRRAADLGASLLTIHSAGGLDMMRAAAQAAGEAGGDSRLRVLAVTVLTSMDDADMHAVGAAGSVVDLVRQRAALAAQAGCDGVVASPAEAALIRADAPPGFLIVTPGVRPAGVDAGDQKRVMTPRQARAAGADYVVVGRPVRDADDPAAAARAIVSELS